MLRVLYRVEAAWELLAAAAMFAIMLILVTDALGRYLFTAPLPWANDIVTRLLLPATFFFALSSTLRVNQHVNIDVVYRKLDMRAQNVAMMVCSMLAGGLFLVIGALGARTAYRAYLAGETMSGAIEWPVWWYATFVPLGALPLVIRLAVRARETALRARHGAAAPDWQPGSDPGAAGL